MSKKIIILILIIIILIAGLGIYFRFFKKPSLKADIEGIEIPEIKMPFESNLGDLELNSFDVGVSLPSNLFSNISVDTNLGGYKGETKIELPSILIGVPSFEFGAPADTGTPPSGWEPNEATCAQFKDVPSCSFVPEEYQDLCEKCKAKGY